MFYKNNKHMKNYILFLFTIYAASSFSQSPLENEAKYWVLRDRLVNDFMVPNYTADILHPGRGIVFNTRVCYRWDDPNFGTDSVPDNTYLYGGFDISDEGFQLGKYLIVLATEWKILKNSNLPTEQTEAELLWALKTIERLDKDAEKYWDYFWSRGTVSGTPNYNGFMLRDDVFTNFLWYNSNFPTPINGVNNEYYVFFQNQYGYNSLAQTPPSLIFNNDAYENYRYLNQGTNGLVGKYISRNIMLHNTSHQKIYDLRETNRLVRNEHEVKSFSGLSREFPKNRGFSAAMAGLYHCYDYNKSTAANAIEIYDRSEFREHYWTGPEEYSLDNYIGLTQGLAAIIKFVNPQTNSNSSQLNYIAKEQLKKIITSIKNNDSWNNDWIIDNPSTEVCVKGVFWDQLIELAQHDGVYGTGANKPLDGNCNAGGADAYLFSGQLALVYEKWINDEMNGDLLSTAYDGLIWDYMVDNTTDTWWQGLLFGNLVQIIGSVYLHYHPIDENEEDNPEWLSIMSAVTAGGTNGFPNLFNSSGLNDYAFNKHLTERMNVNRYNNEYYYLDLLFCALHDVTEPIREASYYNERLDNVACPDIEEYGDNKLSFMITHNLMKIVYNQKYNYLKTDDNDYPLRRRTKCIDELEEGDRPVRDCLCNIPFTTVTGISIESTATIRSNNEIPCCPYSTEDSPPCPVVSLLYQAAYSVTLKPGFKVYNGALFKAEIIDSDICMPKEGNPDVSVLQFPPSSSNYSNYVSNTIFSDNQGNNPNINTENTQFSIINERYDSSEDSLLLGNREFDIFQIIPNPASHEIMVKSKSNHNITLVFYNSIGALLYKQQTICNQTFDISNLDVGYYIVNILVNDKLHSKHKLIITR